MKKTCMILLNMLVSLCGFSQENLQEAQALSYGNKFADAEIIYARLVAKHPNEISYQIAQGYNFSWWKKFDEAIEVYKNVLLKNRNNSEALVGLGYAYSWSGQTSKAIYPFGEVLKMDRKNIEALKGLGYTYLMDKNTEGAKFVFNELQKLQPEKSEYRNAMSKVYILKNNINKAKKELEVALQLDPESEETKYLLSTLPHLQSEIEIQVLAGSAIIDDQTTYGLRLIEINYNHLHKYLFSVRLDNSLSIDNYSLFNARELAPTLWLAVGTSIIKNNNTRIELGNRFLHGFTPLAKLEHIVFLPGDVVFKLSGITGLNKRTTERMASIGIDMPILPATRLDVNYFLAKESPTVKFSNRWLGILNIKPGNKLEISVGGFFGTHGLEEKEYQDENIKGGYLLVSVPVKSKLSLIGFGQYESGVLLNTASFGLGFRLKLK